MTSDTRWSPSTSTTSPLRTTPRRFARLFGCSSEYCRAGPRQHARRPVDHAVAEPAAIDASPCEDSARRARVRSADAVRSRRMPSVPAAAPRLVRAPPARAALAADARPLRDPRLARSCSSRRRSRASSRLLDALPRALPDRRRPRGRAARRGARAGPASATTRARATCTRRRRRSSRDHGGASRRPRARSATLPGIGRYTAGAVASIAFGARRRRPSTRNVARVLAPRVRVRGRKSRRRASAATWALVDALVPRGRAGDWNQALMDLGAHDLHRAGAALRCVCPVKLARAATRR